MSDKTDREYRQNMLTILNRFYRGRGGSLLTKDECEAMEYAISSIETDLKYDLLYEETNHIADADKKIEPTTNDCETCIHNKGILECDMYGCKYEPTTKNDLGVDCISREATVKRLCNLAEYMNEHKENSGDPYIMAALFIQDNKTEFPSVTPQEPRWIPVSERLPKTDEYVGNVAKYYLVQNEYGDMLVARYTHSEYWEQIYQLKPVADEIVAWMPLPPCYDPQESEAKNENDNR